MCQITEAYCVHVAACVTSQESEPKARPPKQCSHRRFSLESTKLPAIAISLKDENEAIICPTHKQGPVIWKCQSIDRITVLDEGSLQ